MGIFFKKNEVFDDDGIGEDLTEEQKRLYRKQYVSTILIGLVYTVIFGGAIFQTINIIFSIDELFFIGAVFSILAIREYVNAVIELRDEILNY